MNPASHAARTVAALTDVALEGLPMTDVDRIEDALLAEVAGDEGQAEMLSEMGDVCEMGGFDDGTLRVCCSTHQRVLCAHHYARTHSVETMPAWQAEHACSPLLRPRPAWKP